MQLKRADWDTALSAYRENRREFRFNLDCPTAQCIRRVLNLPRTHIAVGQNSVTISGGKYELPTHTFSEESGAHQIIEAFNAQTSALADRREEDYYPGELELGLVAVGE